MRFFETQFLPEAEHFLQNWIPQSYARFFTMWILRDKRDHRKTLVIATHGLIKKVNKVPANELDRALRLREKYFNPPKG
jgi:hypothetical protein